MTPKSLLRHPKVASPLRDLAEGRWQPVIDDTEAQKRPKQIKRLILCSGKVYVDLITSEFRAQHPEIAIVRVEQLYPLPFEELKEVIERYHKAKEVVWVQEEPENMGAWRYIWPYLKEIIGDQRPLHYIGRRPSSSPAEGSAAQHKVNQEALIEQAFNMEREIEAEGVIWLKNR
jgi:2-oxoglutarate dehydrogenase E1 component